jgi:hypothetical protein
MCIDYRKLNKSTKKDHSRYPSLMKCWNSLQTTLSFVSLMVILAIIKSQSTPMTKVRPLLHAHMERTHTDECRSGYAMPRLPSNGA